MLLRHRPERYRHGHPNAADILLLIEVSDTTLKFDLGAKLRLYAAHGIPEVWVVDLIARKLHCARQPTAQGHQSITVLYATDSVEPAALPNVRLQLSAFLS